MPLPDAITRLESRRGHQQTDSKPFFCVISFFGRVDRWEIHGVAAKKRHRKPRS